MFGVYSKEVCILQKGDEVVLRCFVQCINCSYCPSGNKTPLLFCLGQLLRINLLLFVQTPPLMDTDVLDHPGLNTCIFTIFNVFDIHTNNYNTCIFTIFDVFDIHTNNYNTCIFTIFDIRTNNYNTCIFTIFNVFNMKCMYFILFTI